jgi:endonuclease I
MKNYLYLLLLCNTLLFAQIPQGYYDNATGTGYALKTQLYSIVSPHNTLVFGSGLWNLYTTSDVRPDGYVWEIYSNCNFTFGTVANGGQQDDGTLGTIECQRFNKEHTFPKSWFGGQIYPMYSDAMIVMPSDKKDNGMRGNLVYANVNPAVTNSIGNGWRIGSCVTPNYPYALQVFEPADQFKGDFARNYFYMATCYENQIANWQNLDPNGNTVLDGTSDKVFEQWYLEMLYSWHVADPVSAKEIDRNNAVYAAQGNRNPFIDHPEYVQIIWGEALSTSTYSYLSKVTVYPNPSTDGTLTLTSEKPLDEIDLITVNGQILQKITQPKFQNNTYTLSNLPKGFYFLQLKGAKETLTKKVVVN